MKVALAALLDPTSLVFLLAGILSGLVVGLIPGLGGTGAVAILLPFVFVLEPQQALAQAETQEIKDALRRNTDEAIARGAFGAPTFFVGDEMFFGNDRLMFLERVLSAS